MLRCPAGGGTTRPTNSPGWGQDNTILLPSIFVIAVFTSSAHRLVILFFNTTTRRHPISILEILDTVALMHKNT